MKAGFAIPASASENPVVDLLLHVHGANGVNGADASNAECPSGAVNPRDIQRQDAPNPE